jgi:hypothetical protein
MPEFITPLARGGACRENSDRAQGFVRALVRSIFWNSPANAEMYSAMRADLPPHVRVYTVSMDLPFAQARWLTTERVAHQALSAHRGETFGQDYGVLIKEWRLLQRAVIVIDRNDRIVHSEYVAARSANRATRRPWTRPAQRRGANQTLGAARTARNRRTLRRCRPGSSSRPGREHRPACAGWRSVRHG